MRANVATMGSLAVLCVLVALAAAGLPARAGVGMVQLRGALACEQVTATYAPPVSCLAAP